MVTSNQSERRLSFRYRVELPIELVLADGAVLTVDACNISTEGIQFKCDCWLADEIDPRGIQNHATEHIHLKVVASLPLIESTRLYVRCRVVTARRLSQDEYLIGLGFVSFENGSDKILDCYLKELCNNYNS